MTVAAAFTLDDGLLFCADTQHSSTLTLESTKLFHKRYASGARSVFAICGDVPYCRMLVQDCEEAMAAMVDNISQSRVRAAMKGVFAETFASHIFPDPQPVHVEILMGIYCPKDKAVVLLESQRASVSILMGYDIIGSGSDLGHYLIRREYQSLRDAGKNNLDYVFNLVMPKFKEVKDWADGCGKSTESIWIRKDGTMSDVARISADTPEEWSKGLIRLAIATA